jgi:hypothetical protein
MIAMVCDKNPTKVTGSKHLLPRLQIMLDGYRKVDPLAKKKMPVQADVPELLVEMAYTLGKTNIERAIADLTMIAFYFLLRVGEYTVKGLCNNTKQTVQFNFEDVNFFKKNIWGQLRCFPHDAPDNLIASADGAMLKLDNQKNGWKGVCVYHKSNGNKMHCPVQALARQYLHLCHNIAAETTFLSAYYDGTSERHDVTNKDVSKALKVAAIVLDYPAMKGIPINRINTHPRKAGE